MTISFSGLASGLDTSSWVESLVAVKQEEVTALQTKLTALQSKKSTLTSTQSVFSSLRSSIEKLTDTKFGGTFDLFSINAANSSNDDVFTATADSTASRQKYSVVVQQLATCTKATSKNTASDVADDSTKLSDLGLNAGTLNVYLDGEKKQISIESGDTFGDLRQKFSDAGVNLSIDSDGILTLSAQDSTKELNIGSTTDSSNFVSLYSINKQTNGTYTSDSSLYKVTTATKLTSANSGFKTQITEGTFTIGDATFTIDSKTTLSSIISEINGNSKAQVTASWDDSTGKMVLTSNVEGASYINIESGTSNFTDVMGFTTTSVSDGTSVSRMYTDNQELGQNALLSINGTDIVSTSNTVKSDVSRLTGVTLNLHSVSEKDDDDNVIEDTLDIEQDSEELVSAIENFVEKYNNIISTIDDVTASGADLERDTSLKSFKNSLRSFANGSNTYNGGTYKLLSQLGISTGEADSSNLSTDCDTLEFDKDTFLEALNEDPESVKALLAGENGILSQMENLVEQMLAASNGYFDVMSSTVSSDISNMESKITKQQDKVTAYQTSLENKFYKMELAISEMQQNYSSFLSSDSE